MKTIKTPSAQEIQRLVAALKKEKVNVTTGDKIKRAKK